MMEVTVDVVSAHRGTEPFRRPEAVMDNSLAGFCDDLYGYGMCLWTMLTGQGAQETLWKALQQKVDTHWFAWSARHQRKTWGYSATERRHCTIAYGDPDVNLRLQVTHPLHSCIKSCERRLHPCSAAGFSAVATGVVTLCFIRAVAASKLTSQVLRRAQIAVVPQVVTRWTTTHLPLPTRIGENAS